MADYEPVGPTETAAQDTKQSNTNQPNRPHAHHHSVGRHNNQKKNRAMTMKQLTSVLARSTLEDDDSKHKNGDKSRENHINRPHAHHNKKKKNHDSGATTMKQLAKALAKSNLRDYDDSQSGHGKKLTKTQCRKQMRRLTASKSHVQIPGSVAATKSGGQNGQSTTRAGRRRARDIRRRMDIPFDNLYLSKVNGFWSSMTNDQIMDWVKSVFRPHIMDWYHECLSVPENQSRVEDAQAKPSLFAKSVVNEAMDQHDSSGLLGSLLGEKDACPTAFHVEKKRNNSLTFIQHSAMVACLVVRDGQLNRSFTGHARKRKRHQAAAALLISVIMDLKTDFGYFARLLLDFKEKDAPTIEDRQTLSVMGALEEEGQGFQIQTSVKKAPRVLRLSSEVFGSIDRALLGLKNNSDCEISFHRSDTVLGEYQIFLDGTLDQVREAQQAIQALADSSPVSAELDLLPAPVFR